MNLRTEASVIFLVLGTVWLMGQEREFTASAPASVKAGEQFQYVVEGSEQGDVLLPGLSDFQILAGPFSSYSSHSQWINGKMTMKTVVTYTHVLRAKKQGTFTIPPATIRVGQKEYKTNPVEIVVGEGEVIPDEPGSQESGTGDGSGTGAPEGSEPVFLRITPSRKEVYLGEQFVSGLRVYTRVNTRPASSAKDIPYEGFYKKALDPDANARRQEINGQQYITQVVQRHILIPQKTGEITIGPYESEWMVQKRMQRRGSRSMFDDFFDDPFFSSYQDVPVKLSTRPVAIRVKPLPPGAPEGFTGGVGKFRMEASLSESEVEVNEAISLKVTISGTGNIPLLGEPQVNLPPDHDIYDVTRSVSTSTSGNRINGSVTFEFPIVARHPGRFRIAPIRFAWFDPEGEAYHTSSTREFNFTVERGESVEAQGDVYVPGLMQESVEDIGTDIRDITRDVPDFTPLATTLLGKRWYQLAFLAVLMLTALTGIIMRKVVRRNADLKLVRNRQASRSARSRLKRADRLRKSGEQELFYEEVGKAIWEYLSAKLDMDISDLSRDAVLGELESRQVTDDTRAQLLGILEESEFSRFAPSSGKSDVNRLYRDAAALIDNLDKTL